MSDPKNAGKRRRVSLFGATGSIGASTVNLLGRYPEMFEVEVLAAARDAEGLARAALAVDAKLAVIDDPAALPALREALAGSGIEVAAGSEAMIEAAGRPVDLVVAAIIGAAGLAPTLAAIEAGANVALANKECLVSAGDLFMSAVQRKGVKLLPVDSEHNAVFQALGAGGTEDVDRIILTASGGPFRGWSLGQLEHATPEQAAAHPNWSMGKKISVDSATLLNKGLELIEAHHLFGVPGDRLDVLIHPQSIVHGLVAYRDGSVVSQMSVTDMRVPLAYCLWWPQRRSAPAKKLDLVALHTLTFEEPDRERFPGLTLARNALEAGGAATNILNAANEVAVDAFLRGRIGFLDIVALAEEVLAGAAGLNLPAAPRSLDDALAIDAEGRRLAREQVEGFAAKRRRTEMI